MPLALGPGLGLSHVNGNQFSLAAFMGTQADGFYYDFTNTDRFFQESIGPTLADDNGESIGLGLDQRLWGGQTLAQIISSAPNLLVGSWTAVVAGSATAVESPAGTLTLTGDGTNAANFDQSFTTVAGQLYAVTQTSSANTTVRVGTSQGATTFMDVGSNAGETTRYFTATGTTTWLRYRYTIASSTVVSGISVKAVPGHAAVQATSGARGARQSTGIKFDGADDNLLTNYLAGSGSNFIVALVTVPASLAADQLFVGTKDSSNGRFFIGFNTSGNVVGGVGADSVGTLVGSVDYRNQEVNVGISIDGSSVRLFGDAVLAYSGAQNGAISTTVPLRAGAINNNGSAGSFFGGSIKRVVAGREFLTLSRYLQIRSALLAA